MVRQQTYWSISGRTPTESSKGFVFNPLRFEKATFAQSTWRHATSRKRKEPITGIGRARPSCAQIRVIQSPLSHGCADVARGGASRRIRMGPNWSHRAATWLATDPLNSKEPDHWAQDERG